MKKRVLAMLLMCVMLVGAFPISAVAADIGNNDEPVAIMSIFSYTANYIDTGHSWLYFKNISDHEITVGHYMLAPGETVSVGTFCFTRNDGAGVYYNIEEYCVNKYGASGRVSLSQEITEDELRIVSNTINSNNRWTIATNCAWFAAKVWNKVADIKVFSGSTPSCLKTSMRVEGKNAVQTNKSMNSPDRNHILRQKGSSLVVVSDASLKNKL